MYLFNNLAHASNCLIFPHCENLMPLIDTKLARHAYIYGVIYIIQKEKNNK